MTEEKQASVALNDHGHIHIVVDFSNLFYRAYFAFKKLNTEGEVPVSGLYGSIKILSGLAQQALKTKQNFQFHFALDGYPKHRYELFPDYKKKRREDAQKALQQNQNEEYDTSSEIPLNLTALMKEEVNATLQQFPSTWYKAADFEADDVIATIVQQLRPTLQPKDIIWIYTTDQDLYSLISEQVIVLDKHGKHKQIHHVLGDYGVVPHKIPLYKAFLGDQSDCLPRIPKVRAIHVVEYLRSCNTVEEVYDLIEKTEKRQNDLIRFRACREQVERNYKVACLRNDLKMEKREVYPTRENFNQLRKHLQMRKCSSLLSDIRCFFPTTEPEQLSTIIVGRN